MQIKNLILHRKERKNKDLMTVKFNFENFLIIQRAIQLTIEYGSQVSSFTFNFLFNHVKTQKKQTNKELISLV